MGQFEPLEYSKEFSRVFTRVFNRGQTDTLIGGIDEAGRGALAGPLSVAMVVFSPEFFKRATQDGAEKDFLLTLDDSKKLSTKIRQNLLPLVKQLSLFAKCVMVPAKTIDKIGINPATEFAILRLVNRFEQWSKNRYNGKTIALSLLVDGNYKLNQVRSDPRLATVRTEVKGDSRIASIAAASILAKVLRDNRMTKFDRFISGYDFSSHKGYGTVSHRRAIVDLGQSRLHRKSYQTQLSLFKNLS
ncbi:MAG: ribonuclease HII [Leptonema sp. (in: Bacteria)]|nr:ribonuclease HII [Leptonema sp. (in: bacteria)]